MAEINSNFSTLHLLVLKELRFERNVHQGVIAQVAGKSPSAWNKVENGQSALTVDTFFGACNALQMSPSGVLNIVERLIPIFNANQVFFHASPLESGEDGLLPLVLSYFNSKGFEALRINPFSGRASVLNLSNPFSAPIIPTVVSYCIDPKFKEWVDAGAQPSNSSVI